MSVNPRISKTINNYYCNSIEFDGGVNTYLYVGANPLSHIDVNGNDWVDYISDWESKDFVLNIIRPTLRYIGSQYDSTEAEQLLLGTALQESGHFIYRIQRGGRGGGPGRGIYQIEESTVKFIYDKYLFRYPFLRLKIASLKTFTDDNMYNITYNDSFATAIARIKYWYQPESIPKDILGQAYYWKKYYNTYRGKGQPEEYLQKWEKYVYPLAMEYIVQ